jgi:hypothetical protein
MSGLRTFLRYLWTLIFGSVLLMGVFPRILNYIPISPRIMLFSILLLLGLIGLTALVEPHKLLSAIPRK